MADPRRHAALMGLGSVMAVSFAAFVMLSVAVNMGATAGPDFWLRAAIHRESSPVATAFAVFCSFLGSTVWLACLTVILAAALYLSGWRSLAGRSLFAMVGAVALNNILKYSFQRPRPMPFFGIAPETFSYPSGHALYATTFYTVAASILLMLVRRIPIIYAAVAASLIILLVGWSRIYLGVHYPSDVLGGMLVGAFWLAVWFAIPSAKGQS